MEYRENGLRYEDYCKLRESVEWLPYSKEQTQKALDNSLYTITAVDGNQTIGMGRLIGDGVYYLIADIVVHPNYQKQGVGNKIVSMIIEYVEMICPLSSRQIKYLKFSAGDAYISI